MLGNGPLGWEEQRRQLSGTAAMDRLAEARAPGRLQADHRYQQAAETAELLEQGPASFRSGSQQPRSPACSRRSSACLASVRHEPGAGQRPLPSPPPSALESADKCIYTKNWTVYPIRGKYIA